MKHGSSVRGNVLLVIAVLIALNIAGLMYFGRIDLSEGRIFTLTDYSRQVVESLEEPVTVKVFFSEDVGPQYNQNRTYIKDMLEDYKAWSHGRFTFEMVNPREKEAFESEARSYRIQPVQAQALENDQLTVKMVYMGLAFLAGDRTETIPFLGEVNGLEYLITSTIRRLTAAEMETIGFLQGHGEPDFNPQAMNGMPGQQGGLSTFAQTLIKDFKLKDVDLGSVDAIDPTISTLLWVRPTEEVSEADLYKLDQFLMRGGRLGLFLDKITADLQTQQATPMALGLDSWLKSFGIKLNDNLIADARCGNVQVRQGGGGLMSLFALSMKYPLFVELLEFDEDHPVSRDLENAMLFFPSSLDTSSFASARAMGLEIKPIVSSSEFTEIQQAPAWNLAPLEKLDQTVADTRFISGSQVLAASVEGSFKSWFADRELPEGVDPDDPTRLTEGVSTRVAVIGDGDFVSDGYAQQGNLLLAQNIVDWLSLDEGLISIRGKTITTRPLDETSPAAKKWIKWLNILGVPMLLVLFGLMRWSSRRRRAEAA